MIRTLICILSLYLIVDNQLKSQNICVSNIETIPVNSNTFEASILGYSIFLKDNKLSNTFNDAIKKLNNCQFEKTKIEGNFERLFNGKFNTWTYWRVKNLTNEPLQILIQADFDGDSLWYFNDRRVNSLKIKSEWKGFSMYRKCIISIEGNGQYEFLLKQNNKLHMGSSSFPLMSAFHYYENKYFQKSNFIIYGYFFLISFIVAVLIFVIVHYINFKEKATLFYSLYLFSVLIVVWRNFEGVNPYFTSTLPWLPWFKTKTILTASIFIFYFLFISSFIEKEKKWVFKATKIIIYIFIAFIVLDFFLIENFPKLSYFFYFISRQIIVIFGLISLILVFNSKEYLAKYIFIGSIILMVTDLFSGLIKSPISSLLPSIGVLIEAIIFTIVLGMRSFKHYSDSLKSKIKVLELEKENEIKTAKIKTQIAQDLHDDMGINLSSLKFITHAIKSKNKQSNISENLKNLEVGLENISTGISEIIWSMNPEKDNLSEYIFDIKKMAESVLTNQNISLELKTDILQNDFQINGAKRRAVLFCIKEAINNALKHSKADKIEIIIDQVDQKLRVKIMDNGKGFHLDLHASAFLHGNGLKNMEKRMREIGGNFKIESENGTTACLEVPLEAD